MSTSVIAKRIFMLPLQTVAQILKNYLERNYRNKIDYIRAVFKQTYCKEKQFADLNNYFQPLPLYHLVRHQELFRSLASKYCKHYFNLLGSGWLQVSYGMSYSGLEGHCYRNKTSTNTNSKDWLKEKINSANYGESLRIWKMIDTSYIPINWQVDFKSGFNWSENTWSKNIRYGNALGADVKVPWELARMQHLPQLAWIYALAKNKEGFEPPDHYLCEFRNQVLDFIATNPPGFGVNWYCTMDVAIRAANLLVAYDLFRAYGAQFDCPFKEVFCRSIYEHGKHVVKNLEWSPEFHGNHYLAGVVGLLFISAYLHSTPEIDAWLAFAVQELINEVDYQFYPDGTNFEASTSYHRLSTEMVIYATALVMGLPLKKRKALTEYDHSMLKSNPKLKHAPIPFFPLKGSDDLVCFPDWYIDKLIKMADFTSSIISHNGHVPQIGDNDNGRFLKLQPFYDQLSVANAKSKYINLANYCELPSDEVYLDESYCNHNHLLSAMSGLLNTSTDDDSLFEREIIYSLCKGNTFNTEQNIYRSNQDITIQRTVHFHYFPFGGFYIYRSPRFCLLIRCGNVGQRGKGGHAHNDQLSFELTVGGLPIFVDPGTYLYTPIPDKRNLFRSTRMHNVLAVEGKEQNIWRDSLFELSEFANAKILCLARDEFFGEQRGFGSTHRRRIKTNENYISGVDEYASEDGAKSVLFHLSPEIVIENVANNQLILKVNSISVTFSSSNDIQIEESSYSPGYGLLRPSSLLKVKLDSKRIDWSISLN